VEPIDVDRYCARIGLDVSDVTVDLDGLAALQHAHLAAVPFENLDIVFAGGVVHDRPAAIDKIVARRRGGWCFELNASFGALLEAIGFDVVLLGAAVLLDGPTSVIDHLTLEVSGTNLSPHLVDVGFGDSFERPLALNRRGPQAGGSATFELIASPQGTTLTKHVDDVPEAQFRFKRVALDFAAFADVAQSLQRDPSLHWSSKPFATRLIDTYSFDRVTLTEGHLKVRRDGVWNETPSAPDQFDSHLATWFGITDHRDRPASPTSRHA
jgi:N-hydroxyarylamine O-acetyltransferase